jgi:hypothetical protein
MMVAFFASAAAASTIIMTYTYPSSSVPEPASTVLMSIALLGMAFVERKRVIKIR